MTASLPSGTRLGQWSLVARCGQGAFGTVWRAVDDQGNPAAIKLLPAPPGDELRALARICHPGVVGVLGGGGDPVPWLAMELVPGRSLTDAIAERPLELAEITAIAAALADALSAAHHANVVHGDLKPDNVILPPTDPPRPVLVDFGLAGTVGGSVDWASPETAGGRRSTPASDVYSLGLLVWVMLHREMPWSDLGTAMALVRRRSAVPRPTNGPPWLRALISTMLAVEPSMRPSAAEVADTLQANGATLAPLDAELIARRTRSINVPQPLVEERIASWLDRGGVMAICGPRGSGRTHALERVVTELRARGLAWVRLVPSSVPWGGIAEALADNSLPGVPSELPREISPAARAQAAATDLETRFATAGSDAPARRARFSVVIDDLEELDDGTRLVVDALARRGTANLIVTTAGAPPPWARQVVRLDPLDRAGLGLLVSGALGSDVDALVERVLSVSGGLPGPAVQFLVAAVRAGAVVRRSHRWLADETRLDELALRGSFVEDLEAGLSADALLLGQAAAVVERPATLDALAALAALPAGRADDALAALVTARLVVVESSAIRCRSRATAHALLTRCADPAQLHRAVLADLAQQSPIPFERLGWHLVGAQDADQAARLGPAAIAAARTLDPTAAAPLADALWHLAPVPALVAPRVEALASAGRTDDALEFARGRIADPPVADDVPVLLAVAQLHASVRGDDAEATRCLAEARKAAGDAPGLPLFAHEARVHFQAARYAEVVAVADEVATLAPPSDPIEQGWWLDLQVMWAQALHKLGDLDRAIAILEAVPREVGQGTRARALLDAARGRLLWHAWRLQDAGRVLTEAADSRALPAAERGGLLNNAALVRYQTGDLAGALANWETALLLFERMEATRLTVPVLVNLCVGYAESARWDRALQSGEAAARVAVQIGDFANEAMAWGNLGDVHLARDEYDLAERCYARSAGLADKHGLAGEKVELTRRRAELAVSRHTSDGAMRARDAERLAVEQNVPFEACRAAALVAVCAARAGDFATLTAAAARATGPLQSAGAARELAVVRVWLAEAWAQAGRTEDARSELDRAIAYADEVGNLQLRMRADALAASSAPMKSADEHLELLVDLALVVARERDLPTLLDAIAKAALDILQADRSFVLIVEGGNPRVVADRRRAGVAPGQPSMTVVRRALSGNREVIAADVGERGDLRGSESVAAMALRSVMCVPLIEGTETLGAIYVDSHTASEQELAQAARFLRSFAAQAAVAVTNARRLRDAVARSHRAAEIAHDLRGPAAVIGEIARELTEHTPNLAEIARDLKLVSGRIDAMGRAILAATPLRNPEVDVMALTSRACTEVSRIARRAGVVIEAVVGDPALIEANAQEVERALLNLLGNAVRHSPRGTVVNVTVDVKPESITFVVRDHGPGIHPDIAETLFERGVRGPEGGEGYGLGLSIVKRVAQEHGGSVKTANHPDGGAVFSLTFPRAARRRATTQ